jgi:hypothetical protein
MKNTLFRFTRDLAIMSLSIIVIAIGIHFMNPAIITPALPWIILFFILVTFLMFRVLSNASSGKITRFTNYFMIATVSKLLILLGAIALYVYFFRNDAIRFVITIFILYITYTLLEVIWLLRIQKMK